MDLPPDSRPHKLNPRQPSVPGYGAATLQIRDPRYEYRRLRTYTNGHVSGYFIDTLFQLKASTFSSTHDQLIILSTEVRRASEIYRSLRHVRVS